MKDSKVEFDFERLDVYRLALDFLSRLFKLYKTLPRDIKYTVGENLIRAGVSISNKLAEGSGKKFKKEKSKYYGISLDSTRECVSMINVLRKEEFLDEILYSDFRYDTRKITGKIANLIDSTNNSKYTVHRKQ